METAQFQLDVDFKPYDLITWYHRAEPGDMAVIILPSRGCPVRLIRGYRDSVCWWPEGGRSMTIELQNAVARLTMFQSGAMSYRPSENRPSL